ncbi:MAG: hypothetical protein IK151_07400 [Erysipelotrichaceae bacterium]|nr:hypothetical protein [Erysipelotrichaceae bacterium]
MKENLLNEEELNLVSGGQLVEGWDKSVMLIMQVYKGKYINDDDGGRQRVKDLMVISANDPSSPLEAQDLQTVYNFIDANWETVKPLNLPL